MKKINLHWSVMRKFIKKNKIQMFNRVALCYPVDEFNKGIKKNPFTIFDHQKNNGKKLGYQKEGIQINFEGNPKNIDFENELIFIPK